MHRRVGRERSVLPLLVRALAPRSCVQALLTFNSKAFLPAYRALRDIQPDIPVVALLQVPPQS
jgi:hypothetical protein